MVKGTESTKPSIISRSQIISKEELVQLVINELWVVMYNWISTNEVCKILKDKFGVLEQYCCDLVQQLKIELDMYCPDRQHLYYVEARFS